MTITITSKNRLRDLMIADITSMTVGTDGTSATTGDTDLGAEIAGVSKTPSIITQDRTINFQYTIYSTEGTGNTIKEAGVFMNSDTIMLDRVVFPDFVHTTSNELTVIDIINIL